MSLEKLNKLVESVPVDNQEGMKLKIVRQSIERGWTGFFEVKENESNSYSPKKYQNYSQRDYENTSDNDFYDDVSEFL